ncbi:DNA repair protein RecO C-terminal domain-containing protein [Pseudoalteromonas sp. Of7M-16]|uniref:DNA repair protein RecO n=1 Tax=Pseudoalteromonas sp. Of7M-16 TaxID=2917756 RepID=UPI001EF5ACA5|nr:DNA repair protein RecO C-terminal domain-containing protein [Pseudoalteromonas sp. Of7M-16]MCG7548270.1 DNA repair protein RecO C-terminal domain-containing protein [Pseudoalteromonas sp. Of7M-16]
MDSDFRQAYLLHRRPYRDSQVMLNMLVEGVGQLSMLARIKGKRAVKQNAALQPFTCLLVRYAGKYDLKYLNDFEIQSPPLMFKGTHLYCAFYLNELSHRIIPINEPLDHVFCLYQDHLKRLYSDGDNGLAIKVNSQQPKKPKNSEQIEEILRTYEFKLLYELGVGVEFDYDAFGTPIDEGSYYQFVREVGFCPSEDIHRSFSGKTLLAIAHGDYGSVVSRRQAKALSRYLLKPLLGNKPLKSRELFQPR